MSDVHVAIVDFDLIEGVWPMVEPMLRMATDTSGGRYDTLTVLQDICNGKSSLWAVWTEADGVLAGFTTTIVDYPLTRRLSIPFLGGNGFLEHLDAVDDAVTQYAKAHGCTGIEVIGRRGWQRALKRIGFDYSFTSICKEF